LLLVVATCQNITILHLILILFTNLFLSICQFLQMRIRKC
jgi:hypothetical protein